MAGFRFFARRIRRIFSSPTVQIASVCLFVFLGIRFVVLHNHDDVFTSLPPAASPTARVDDKGIDWSKLYYVQYVTSPEYLCNALMVWSQIEEIGSRAQVEPLPLPFKVARTNICAYRE
jgi:peptidoglycan/LPS O-acetylase OafA/YrhL